MTNWQVTYSEARTPLGVDIAQTYLSVKAGLQRFQDHPSHFEIPIDHPDAQAEPMVISPIAWMDPEVELASKFRHLSHDIIKDWISHCALTTHNLSQIGVFCVLPPAMQTGIDQDSLSKAWSLLDLPSPACLLTMESDSASMLNAIEQAIAWSQGKQVQGCLIMGFDSYLGSDRLSYLDEQRRLKTTRNLDGFIAGEAISLIYIQPTAHPAKISITAVAAGVESQPFTSDKNSSGCALTEAIQEVWPDDAELDPWSDLNGESYRFYEWGLSQTRLSALIKGTLGEIQHPYDCLGDLGAAGGGVLLGLAIEHLKSTTENHALIYTGSDKGARIAVCLTKKSVNR